jgi:hypothetical protein
MANQFYLIGLLTPHMDRRILPSNGVVLRRFFFFLQKLANYRLSVACSEVEAELKHICQQCHLDISTKIHITRKVQLFLNEYNCIRNNRHRSTISLTNHFDSFAEKLNAMFDISMSNAFESIKSKRLQQFLNDQRTVRHFNALHYRLISIEDSSFGHFGYWPDDET